MTNAIANEVVSVKLVKIISLKDPNISQENVGKIFVLSDEEDLSTSTDFVLLKDLETGFYLDIAITNVELEEVGYIKTSKTNMTNYIFSSYRHPHYKFVAENTQNELYVLGRVSEINNFRFLQLTENIALAYTSLHSQDKGSKSTGSNADVYHYIKIGQVEGKSIYVYHSDMVIKDSEESASLEWVGSFENFKGEEIPTTRVISKLS